MQKNLKISIFGKNYTISTDENSEDVVEAARIVDSLMRDKAGQKVAQHDQGQLAITVALELATDLAKTKQQLARWETKIAQINQAVVAS